MSCLRQSLVGADRTNHHILAVGLLALLCSPWAAPYLEAGEGNSLDLEERIRYQDQMERVYAEQTKATALKSAKSTAAGGPLSPVELRAKVEKKIRMADALAQVWGQQITEAALQAEYERILEHSNDHEMLQRLFRALDKDTNVIARCLIEPILIRRSIHRAYWWDSGIHGDLRRQAEQELLSNNGAGGLVHSSGQYTETEWRLVDEGDPRQVEFEDGVQIRYLNRKQWKSRLEQLASRWKLSAAPRENRDSLPMLRFTRLEQEREYFRASVILHSDATRLRLGSYTWWKETFSEWWQVNSDQFSTQTETPDRVISLKAPDVAPRPEVPAKDHVVTADVWYSMNSSDPDTPVAREQHTVVWTGTQMIVWGGTAGGAYFNSGGIYDPATDSWSATSQGADCPSNRIGHSATWLNDMMYVWGGWNETTNYQSGSKYDPTTDEWSTMTIDSYTPTSRHGHGAWARPGNTPQFLIIWGGMVAAGG